VNNNPDTSQARIAAMLELYRMTLVPDVMNEVQAENAALWKTSRELYIMLKLKKVEIRMLKVRVSELRRKVRKISRKAWRLKNQKEPESDTPVQ